MFFLQLHNYGCNKKPEYSNHLIQKGEEHFRNLKQLTFSGENAEAYFSADGKKLAINPNKIRAKAWYIW